jgi:hypothetical protein
VFRLEVVKLTGLHIAHRPQNCNTWQMYSLLELSVTYLFIATVCLVWLALKKKAMTPISLCEYNFLLSCSLFVKSLNEEDHSGCNLLAHLKLAYKISDKL